MGVELLIDRGSLPGYQHLLNSEYHMPYRGSQTMGDKLHGREGDSPDRRLRSQIYAEWHEGCGVA